MTCDRCGVPAGLRWLTENGLWFDEEAGVWRWRGAIAFPDLTQVRVWQEPVTVRQVNLWEFLCTECERRGSTGLLKSGASKGE